MHENTPQFVIFPLLWNGGSVVPKKKKTQQKNKNKNKKKTLTVT